MIKGEDKKDWKNHPIRMSDDLWFRTMIGAGTLKIDLAEFVRQAIEEKLEDFKNKF